MRVQVITVLVKNVRAWRFTTSSLDARKKRARLSGIVQKVVKRQFIAEPSGRGQRSNRNVQ
jgi:hypothetical protein